jgi:transcriptional regulator with XRE-family HTH domain
MPKIKKRSTSTFKFPMLRKEMQNKGYTIESLAVTVGISTSSMRNKMNGTTGFYLDETKLISRLLDKDIDYLFKDEF